VEKKISHGGRQIGTVQYRLPGLGLAAFEHRHRDRGVPAWQALFWKSRNGHTLAQQQHIQHRNHTANPLSAWLRTAQPGRVCCHACLAMSRSASQASLALSSATATSTNSKPLAMKAPNAPVTAPNNSILTSNIKLFVTNLRLLDLDQREDWPDITLQTFSTKNAEQNQKKRIAAAEWALFRLCELWDPVETREVGRLLQSIDAVYNVP
jgi:hypothetical protein